MSDVNFPRYRSYLAARKDANNAMMALLAGSRLAAHTLLLTQGSNHLLPDMFPSVDHIKRFNLTTESARDLLLDADAHLGAVAVPYALAVHEDFAMGCIKWLRKLGLYVNTTGQTVKAWNMHTVLFESMGVRTTTPEMALYHLLREMRNSQIHSGGSASQRLVDALDGLSATDGNEWERLTGRKPDKVVDRGRVRFTAGDIGAGFAITKAIGRHINLSVRSAVPRAEWANVVVRDYAAQTTKLRNSDQWMRSLRGYARMLYADLLLTDTELEVAATRDGVWTRSPASWPPGLH